MSISHKIKNIPMSLFDSTWAAADATKRMLIGWSSESTLNGAWKDGMWDIQDLLPQNVNPGLQRKTKKVEIWPSCFHQRTRKRTCTWQQRIGQFVWHSLIFFNGGFNKKEILFFDCLSDVCCFIQGLKALENRTNCTKTLGCAWPLIWYF